MKVLVKFAAIMAVLLLMAFLGLVGVMALINALVATGRGDYGMLVVCAFAWVYLFYPMRNCVRTLAEVWNKKL